MEEARKNTEKEEILLNIEFQVPISVHILFILFILTSIILAFVLHSPYLFIICSLILICLYISLCLGVIFNECVVTNKVIRGRKFVLFGYKKFSYRLDSISDITSINVLGLNSVKITFNQGYLNVNGKNKPFTISYISQYNHVIEKLNQILENVKNDKDVQVSLSLKQTEALNNIASSIDNQKKEISKNVNALDSIRELKNMVDEGLITQEEYEKKKKDLLERF